MDWMAVTLLFLSDWFNFAVGRAGSVLLPCLGVQINKDVGLLLHAGVQPLLIHCWCSYNACICVQVHGVIRGERGCAVASL